jgi:hypothetical protein
MTDQRDIRRSGEPEVRWTTLSILLLIALFSVASPVAVMAQPRPQLVVENPVIDLGAVTKGKKARATFRLRNQGAKELKLTQVSQQCGCAIVEGDLELKPGKQSALAVDLDTGILGGAITRIIVLETNDPDAPKIELIVHANVIESIGAYPDGFLRYELLHGAIDTKVVTLFSAEEEPFDPGEMELPGDHVVVTLTELQLAEERAPAGREGQKQYEMRVTYRSGEISPGPIREKIVIRTGSDAQPELEVPIGGFVHPRYIANPRFVDFGSVPTGRADSRYVLIRAGGDLEVKPISVNSSHPSIFRATLATNEEDFPSSILVSVEPAVGAGTYEGTVDVMTDDPVQSMITVPVRVIVAGGQQ